VGSVPIYVQKLSALGKGVGGHGKRSIVEITSTLVGGHHDRKEA
jgi:hypothetical protein